MWINEAPLVSKWCCLVSDCEPNREPESCISVSFAVDSKERI